VSVYVLFIQPKNSNTAGLCAVSSLEPQVQVPLKEFTEFPRVKQFTPLPPPCLHRPGPEPGLVKDTLVWKSEEITWSKLRLGLVENFGFSGYLFAAGGFVLAALVTVLLLTVRSCIVYGQIHIYFYHEASPN
jgi:hypothetical protein